MSSSYASYVECCQCQRYGDQVWVKTQPEGADDTGLCQFCRLPLLEPRPYTFKAQRRYLPPLRLPANTQQKQGKES